MVKKIYIIAGENSGDVVGAKLIRAIKNILSNVEFSGIGGDEMHKEGVESLFPMHELSLMGFMEVVPHIPNVLRRINQTTEHITKVEPDVIITIDSPGFCFQLANKVRHLGTKMVHIVAPSVWAWKPDRAQKISRLYDHLIAFLPFEPKYFDEVGLPCTFVGHPVVEEDFSNVDKGAFRVRNQIKSDAPILCIMPGSRKFEITRLLKVFHQAVIMVSRWFTNVHVVILATSRFEKSLKTQVKKWPVKCTVISDVEEKKNAMACADIALAKSGTGTMELAVAKVPMVIAYRINPVSAYIARKMLKIKYVNLINIISDKEVIPEFIQEKCTPEVIAAEITKLLSNSKARERQIKQYEPALEQLGLGKKPTPSEKMAKIILDVIKKDKA